MNGQGREAKAISAPIRMTPVSRSKNKAGIGHVADEIRSLTSDSNGSEVEVAAFQKVSVRPIADSGIGAFKTADRNSSRNYNLVNNKGANRLVTSHATSPLRCNGIT